MAKAMIARPKVTTERESTVSASDFIEPDDSLIGIHLGEVAALLTLLDDLHCEAHEINYSPIGASMGRTSKEIVHSLSACAIGMAGQELVKARAALHDLFREVKLKPTPPKAVA